MIPPAVIPKGWCVMVKSRVHWMFGTVCLIGSLAGGLSAQTPPTPTFEVASIKPNKSGPGSIQRAGLQPGDRVNMTNVTLRILMQIAYPGPSEIIGGPSWIGSGPSGDRFDVNAKAEASSSREQLQLMLRTLLADRFKLVAHPEIRTEPIYALVLARRDGRLGPYLHPAAADCATLRAAALAAGPLRGGGPCGLGGLPGNMHIHGIGIDQLAVMLQMDAGRRVVNKTGLTGNFDWDLTWTPQAFRQTPFDRERFPSIDPDGPSIFTAIEEQLGLKLQPEKGEGNVLVIDHVERPTED
jgi:uncharacterized protein (TIGR03435 family)